MIALIRWQGWNVKTFPLAGVTTDFAQDSAEHGMQVALEAAASGLEVGEHLVVTSRFAGNAICSSVQFGSSAQNGTFASFGLDGMLALAPAAGASDMLKRLESGFEVRPVEPTPGRPRAQSRWDPELRIPWAALAELLAAGDDEIVVGTWLEKVDDDLGRQAMALRQDSRIAKRAARRGLPIPMNLASLPEGSKASVYVRILLDGSPTKMHVVRNFINSAMANGSAVDVYRLSDKAARPHLQSWVNGSVLPARVAARMIPIPILPQRSGLAVARVAESNARFTQPVDLGTIILGSNTATGATAGISLNDLVQHTLVTGHQGFGKSTTMMRLLSSAWEEYGLPWLVIDPVKDEYAAFALRHPATGDVERATHVRLSLRTSGCLFNPLAVPEGVDASTYAGVLGDLFGQLTGLDEQYTLGATAMRKAFLQVYVDWESRHQEWGESGWPTLAHLGSSLERVLSANAAGGSNTSRELAASLRFRFGNFCSSPAGQIMSGGTDAGINWGALLGRPAVVQIDPALDEGNRRILLAYLLAGFLTYRHTAAAPSRVLDSGIGDWSGARHLLVVEEAHMLVPSQGETTLSSLLSDAVARHRAQGQGYVLVTQTPSQLPDHLFDMFPNRITHALRDQRGAGIAAMSLGVSESEVVQLATGEVLMRPAGATQSGKVRVEPPDIGASCGAAPTGWPDSVVRRSTIPDRGWCTRCPDPCRGDAWLSLVPQVVSAELDWIQDGQPAGDLAARTLRMTGYVKRVATAQWGAGFPFSAAGIYCALARSQSIVNQGSEASHVAAISASRETVDGIVAARARPRSGAPSRGH